MTASTPISQVIANLADALDQARAEVAKANARIDDLEQQRHGLLIAAPHTDDIVAAFRKGVSGSAALFEQQLTSNLRETYVRSDKSAEAVRGSPSLLTVQADKPDPVRMQALAMRGEAPEANVAALAYLLRDRIEAELPGLIDRLCPEARHGMRQADRQAALAEIDAELEGLRAERDAMMADVHAARQTAMGRREG